MAGEVVEPDEVLKEKIREILAKQRGREVAIMLYQVKLRCDPKEKKALEGLSSEWWRHVPARVRLDGSLWWLHKVERRRPFKASTRVFYRKL
ncbi:MAG: hypothetical protein LM580_07570 [Thermofilum sp.]|nr:hypothetical protein [Thermofilum sp.]MCC6065882.1 hypothetical protein [Thermofilum sp.]